MSRLALPRVSMFQDFPPCSGACSGVKGICFAQDHDSYFHSALIYVYIFHLMLYLDNVRLSLIQQASYSSLMYTKNLFSLSAFAMAHSKTYDLDVYQPRNPKASEYYKCVEKHFEELAQKWDDGYASRYGFWRRYIMTVIFKYLDCGDLHFGFARVQCEDCGFIFYMTANYWASLVNVPGR